ncbi:restriction endonuclease subunit S [Aliivibrio salmonicida]|uniref:restriction endonuclease subunit S n=1 Tax=Aliivibrio salmonicida TaxID=40269 RepID=UPI00406C3FCF
MVPNSISKLDLVQAQISEIPEGWQLCKVSEALRIRNNFRKPISQEVRETMKGQYPYYGPTKIQDYIFEYEQDGIYALIGEDGDHFLKYSTMSQTQFISGKCTVNNHAHILESSDFCDSEWFFNYFKNRNITNFLSRQGAGRFKLNKATLEKLPMLVPPLPEQRKIAQILSTWDKAITTTEKLIDASKQQKKALMQQLLTGKKRLVDPETGKAFEGEWETKELRELVTFVNGKGHEKNIIDEGKYIVVNSKFISSDGRVYKQTNDAFCPALIDDILMVMSDVPNGKAIAKCFLVNENNKFTVNQRIARFRSKSCNSTFLFYSINRNSYYLEFDDGLKQTNLRKDDVLDCPLKTPPIQEQQKIASVLTAADKEIELLEAKLAHFKQEKKALMQQLLTGKRRVKVEEMEVA